MKKAEIIPTVLDAFHPFLTISVSWKKADVDIGNTIKPKKVKKTPHVQLVDDLPKLKRTLPQLTLALTDPDAQSRDDPIWSEMCHWIATGIPLTSDGMIDKSQDFKEIVPYKAPAPPKKTGKHRYVFVALTPKNGTHESLNLTAPADRQHWGYGKERMGVRQWAEDNGLAVIGRRPDVNACISDSDHEQERTSSMRSIRSSERVVDAVSILDVDLNFACVERYLRQATAATIIKAIHRVRQLALNLGAIMSYHCSIFPLH